MDVSVIIISYNTCDYTIRCIEEVYKYTEGVSFEIIVVDNNSKDDSVERIEQLYPETILIKNKDNKGFGAANNQAIKIAKGEFLFLLNSDAFLESNAIKEFADFLKQPQNSNIAVVGGNLISGGTHKISSYGNFPTLWELFLLLGPYLLFKKYFKQHISTGVINIDNNIKKVDYIIGADMFIRRNVLEQTGSFDEDFFLNYEETELCYRIKKQGYECAILPKVTIVHLVGASYKPGAAFNYAKFVYYEESRIKFFRKCYGSLSANVAKTLVVVHICLQAMLGRNQGSVKRKIKEIVKI